MLDSKTHSPMITSKSAVADCHTRALFLDAFLTQLSNSRSQLSIFPTATLPFVILFPRKRSMQMTQMISKATIKTAAGKLWAISLMDAAMGALVCALAAVALSAAANGHTWKNMAPLIFTAVLLVIGGLFGSRAGIIGTVVAAMIFASFLFNPVGNIQVADESARGNLGWMMLIGIGFSFLFAPPNSRIRRH